MEFITALRGMTFDDQKPSLFELLSEQQLSALLPPTLRYLLVHATQRSPRYLLPILNSFDEIYALLMVVVERHYLITRGGSFTEHFYGLKREKGLAAEIPRASARAPAIVRETLKLSRADVWRNLAVMVGIPYLKRKLDEGYEVNAPRALLGTAYTTMPANATWKDKILHYYRWFLRNVYPSVNAAYYFALLAFNLAYLFDNSKYHNPFLWMIGTRMRRMTGADYAALEALGKKSDEGAAPGPASFFSPRNMGSKVLSSLSVLLPTSIFALKFLEWWYASDFAKQLSRRAAESLDLPPPTVSGAPETSGGKLPSTGAGPKAGGEEEEEDEKTLAEAAPIAKPSLLPIYTVRAPNNSELCPICRDDITTPTACQTGVVYCYTCVHKWVSGVHPRQEAFMVDKKGKWESGESRCAVTGRRVLGGTEGLRRIMV
ncbi:peroxisome biosynthesis protein [Diaporthe amygdali]|uniref:peroxisome biosynthesis protein n=1 Tax=Phomopsis amygdali TaxID=1214568 RepID=UPI0022FE1C25|nr:peroxisome biosynthesis protein [Diaporthe amygdali]KAJ0115300.1 peroxisome biosynthesis protein [Diaporthe amygdali]